MRSIISSIGTEEFPRLRMGIGYPGDGDLVGHVLGRFEKEEIPLVNDMVERSVKAGIGLIEGKPLQVLMDEFNG